MALTRKTLFKENLEKYQTFVTDTNPNSTYFKISELPDVFTGGKNAFLIQGSEYLVPDTLIKIEIKDANGNVIYHEPGEGIVSSSVAGESVVTEYYEGVSKVVAVHVYPNKTTDINGNTEDGTAYGLCTITILGEVSSYIDTNGLVLPIPTEWEGQYNVKWQRQINVNPSLANTTKIRFYRRPIANITETLSPIYTIVDDVKVQSNIVSSFANIKLSQIDTFAGDVKRIKVFRTSLGDISDADLIQDILVESKELLSTYELTGSVVGNGGLFTSETLEKLWIPTGVTTQLTSSRIDNGVKLDGGGYFKYSSSLNLSDGNIFELGIDAFYSASTASNLGIYVSGSNNGEYLVGTLNGLTPTKNLKDQTISFSLPLAEPTASLYLSQSQGEWHVGNISLKLSQDTAFSPSEIEFVTSMPTVVGNETYKFNFEFYDVNNNYVPVAVTQSALFTGGNNNIGGTLIFISASASSSAAELAAVSSSISGTMTVYSSSAETTITTLSGSVSGSITALSSSVSQSVALTLSSSLSKVQQLADGNYSGVFIDGTTVFAPVIGGTTGYISGKFTVGAEPNSIVLDAQTSTRKIHIGTGTYNNSNTSVYLDSTGKFSLKDKLIWDGTTLTVNGNINVVGGNAATQTYANTIGTNSVLSGSVSANAAQTAAQLFATSAAGRAVESGSASATAAQAAAIAQAKTDASASVNLLANGNWTAGTGTFITANSISSPIIAGNGGYISTIFKVGNNGITLDGTNKKIYVGTGTYNNVNTPFYFASGSTNIFSLGDKLTWDGTTLGVTGNIVITGGATKTAIDNAATAASNAQTTADSKITGTQVNANVTSISGGSITTGTISANRIDVSGIITAGGIVVGGSPISALSNNAGYQANGDAKTAGSVGGWSINSSTIKSNNNQAIFYNTGVISLTDGSTEKILITKDSLTKAATTATLSLPATSDNETVQTHSVSSFNYMNTFSKETTSTATSGQFTAQGSSVILNIGYGGGTTSTLTGTINWSQTLSNFKYVQNTTSKRIYVNLYNAGGTLISTKEVTVYYRQDIGSSLGYSFPYIAGGTTSVAFSGLSTGANYYAVVGVTKRIESSYIAWVFGASLSATWTYFGMQSSSSPIDISAAGEKTSIGVNGMIASSAGGFAQVGPVASIGGTAYSAAFLGNVRVNGEIQASSLVASSDERLKTNIVDIESPLLVIEKLKPKSFVWNNKLAPFSEQRNSFGFIAQDVEKDFPFLVKDIGDNEDINNVLSLDYNAIIPINTAAIKQLLIKIEELEERILELENQ